MGAPREDASYSLQGMSVMAPVSTIVGGIHFELFLARAAEMANFSWPMTDEEYRNRQGAIKKLQRKISIELFLFLPIIFKLTF